MNKVFIKNRADVFLSKAFSYLCKIINFTLHTTHYTL